MIVGSIQRGPLRRLFQVLLNGPDDHGLDWRVLLERVDFQLTPEINRDIRDCNALHRLGCFHARRLYVRYVRSVKSDETDPLATLEAILSRRDER